MRSSKGVTPVVATVLLITISVAATGTAYNFMVNAQEKASDNYEQDLNLREIRRNTEINVESMRESSGGYGILYVRNTGRIPVLIDNEDDEKILNLYEDGIQRDWAYLGADPNPGGLTRLAPGETFQMNSSVTFPPSQSTYRVVGRYGTDAFYTCRPTGSGTC